MLWSSFCVPWLVPELRHRGRSRSHGTPWSPRDHAASDHFCSGGWIFSFGVSRSMDISSAGEVCARKDDVDALTLAVRQHRAVPGHVDLNASRKRTFQNSIVGWSARTASDSVGSTNSPASICWSSRAFDLLMPITAAQSVHVLTKRVLTMDKTLLKAWRANYPRRMTVAGVR